MAEGIIYCVGFVLRSKEDYDRLMNEHSKTGMFGLDFKKSFEGYPPDYPMLLQYTTYMNPFLAGVGMQLSEIAKAGYTIQIELETES